MAGMAHTTAAITTGIEASNFNAAPAYHQLALEVDRRTCSAPRVERVAVALRTGGDGGAVGDVATVA